MKHDKINDPMQFITAVISQQTADLRVDINRLDGKIDDLSESVAEALDKSNEEKEKQFKNHETRIQSSKMPQRKYALTF